ncbi:hypothetical protein GTY65_12375 [Streptomyces sp. SID8379]|uniref:hypothetical protein n=1 Tax=unclassified Streptomyces TaxID=2593676 RepID=UPI00036127F4|nr:MULTISPECIES: hypothetical protein [unclassified Streptomyces]MYW64856.1 hypothetical protein [Streptomyces sp. SID8379]
MAGAEPVGAGTPFPGHAFRVSGLLRAELHQVVHTAGRETGGQESYAYALTGTDAPPEHQLFDGRMRHA